MTATTFDMPARAGSLRDDTRGAVMLTGLFLAFFLVGALWYVIGVGDAIIFRDRMQEAADSAVFSSAAIHAKGMNFISACNIIMLLMVAVHITFGVIQDVTILTCLAAGLGCISCALACPKIPGAIMNFHKWAGRAKDGLTVMSNVESAIALATPWAGTARGLDIGREYGRKGRVEKDVNVFTMGASNIPGLAGRRGILAGRNVPLGLPVRGKPYQELCDVLGQDLVGLLLGWIPYGDRLSDLIGPVVGSFFKLRYCNAVGAGGDDPFFRDAQSRMNEAQDELNNGRRQQAAAAEEARINGTEPPTGGTTGGGTTLPSAGNGGTAGPEGSVNGWSPYFDPGFDKGWGDKGFLVVADGAGNGTQAHQIWSVAMNPKYSETNERRVSTAANVKAQAWADDSEQGSTAVGYFAQGEFYYDCGERWSDEDCNEDFGASFGIRWRARLRRLELPNLFNMLATFATSPVKDIIREGVETAVTGNPLAEKLANSAGGAVAIDALAGVIEDALVPGITNAITGPFEDFASGLMPTGINGSYH